MKKNRVDFEGLGYSPAPSISFSPCSVNSSFLLAGESGDAYQAQYKAAINMSAKKIEAIAKLVLAIGAALSAAAGLVTSIKTRRPAPFASAQLIDTKEYSADESDWGQLPPGTTPETTDNTTLYLAAGAAALLLLNGKK